MVHIKYLCFALMLCIAPLVHSQSITLKEIVDKVNANAPALLTETANIGAKESRLKETKYDWLPSLKLNYQADIGTNNNIAGAYFTEGIIPSSSGGIRQESNTKPVIGTLGVGSLDWELYNFGAYSARNQVAKTAVAAENGKYQLTAFQLQGYAVQYYFDMLKFQQLLAIQQLNIERNRQIKESILSLTNAGLNAGVDTSIAEAELSKARLNYLEVQDVYKQIQVRLASLSGLKAEQIIPDTSISGKLSAVNALVFFNEADTVSHPLLHYYQLLYQNSLAQEKLARRNYNPKLMLQATTWLRASSIKYNDDFQSLDNGFSPSRFNYLVGFSLSYNLFDIAHMRMRVQTQKSETAVTRGLYNEQKAALDEEAQIATSQLKTAQQRLQEIPNQLNAAKEAYQQKLNLYRNGLVNIIDVNIALNVLYRAENDYTLAKDIYYKSVFKLAFATNQVTRLFDLIN